MTFDMHTALPAALADRDAAWEFIRAFAADRATPIEDGDGYDSTVLDACEARLGVRLPVAVRQLYALVGRRGDLTSNHHVLLAPEKLYVEDGMLVFREENQGVCWWGVPTGDAGPDPAVLGRTDTADPASSTWWAWLPSFSNAAIELVMSETVLFDDELVDACDLSETDERALAVLRTHLRPLAFPTGTDEDGDTTLWFADPDVLVRYEPGMATVRARTPERLDAFCALLPGEWIGM